MVSANWLNPEIVELGFWEGVFLVGDISSLVIDACFSMSLRVFWIWIHLARFLVKLGSLGDGLIASGMQLSLSIARDDRVIPDGDLDGGCSAPNSRLGAPMGGEMNPGT